MKLHVSLLAKCSQECLKKPVDIFLCIEKTSGKGTEVRVLKFADVMRMGPRVSCKS